jgi:hypothetical protein
VARGRPARQRARHCGLVAPKRDGRNDVLPPTAQGVQQHLAALWAPSAPAVGGRLPTGEGRPLRGLQRDHRGDDHGRRLNRRLGQDVSPKPTAHHPESSHRPIRLTQVDSAATRCPGLIGSFRSSSTTSDQCMTKSPPHYVKSPSRTAWRWPKSGQPIPRRCGIHPGCIVHPGVNLAKPIGESPSGSRPH